MKKFVILVTLGGLLIGTASAQITKVKLAPLTPGEGFLFGQSVAIAESVAVVSAGLIDANAAFSFRWDGTDWREIGRLIPSDGVEAEGFAIVSTTNEFAIVGAPVFDHPAATNGGAQYTFERTGDSWAQQMRIAPSDVDGQDLSGAAVAIAGDLMIVGSRKHDDDALNSGAAYVFKRSGSATTEQAKLLASDAAAEDRFGNAVAIDGDYAIVGSSVGSGSAYIFHRTNDTTWTEQAKLTASDPIQVGAFGFSVSISGDYAIVGSPGADGDVVISGSVYVFKRDGENWLEQAKLLAGDSESSDFFGGAVAIDGDLAIVGASLADAAYVFHRDGGSWTEIAKMTNGAGSLFGISVSISGDHAIVGAPSDADALGSAYIFSGFSTIVGVANGFASIPQSFTLMQNYPNPFNPTTTIEFQTTEFAPVSLQVYDLLGREVVTLQRGEVPPGNYQIQWDGRDDHGDSVASGVYVYVLRSGYSTRARKMILLR